MLVEKNSKQKIVVCSLFAVNRLAFPRDVAVAFVRALAGPDDAYARLAQHLDGTDGGGVTGQMIVNNPSQRSDRERVKLITYKLVFYVTLRFAK